MAALPTPPLTLRRELHDGARYELAAAAPGVTTLAVHDAHAGAACIALDRGAARQLLEDLTLAAGLTPTAPQLGRAAALAGTVRVLFERLAELKRTEPAAADAIVAMAVAHLRSWDPVSLLNAQVAP